MLDGDWIVYTAGFAGQKTFYLAPQIAGVDEFESMADVKECAKLRNDGETGPVYARTVADPLAHVLHSAKKMIEAQVEKVKEKFNVEDVELQIFIDGSGNFRDRLGTIRPYKGNRIAAKPVYFMEIRQYLVEHWGAEVVYDQESDDEIAIWQTAANNCKDCKLVSVIVAVDKDLLQVPGYHLNPNKGWKRVSEAEGLWRLYVQAATGDSTDNIGGAYKVGPAGARKVFDKLRKAPEEDLWKALVSIYEGTIEKYGEDLYGELTAEEAALENMRLVYLCRDYNETWLPPGERSE